MKTATVADLRNHFSRISKWIEAGETIQINKRGKQFARLIPGPGKPKKADWSGSIQRRKKLFAHVTVPDSQNLLDTLRGDS
ncbi:hypothetical protein QQ056_06415 [Oscillatoria laete-virens NRMC-F 0139]|nr:hypothetical protein [Oscillatoria laete-virens]MDL5053178.1 hypothetical protein [Oscillatoria laete-virens NRMC-F 0139]